MQKPIPILTCVDVEPREREPRSPEADWAGFEETVEMLEDFRGRMAEASGRPVRFNWFIRMDPQIERLHGDAGWAARRYAALLEKLRSRGDELGLHVHAWRWDNAAARWLIDHADSVWVRHCADVGLKSFSRVFGRRCRYFRFGDGWVDNALMDHLERAGVTADLSLEPGYPARKRGLYAWETSTGTSPDTRRTPRSAYFPSRRDFRKRGVIGRRRIREIPITTGALPFPGRPRVTFNLAFHTIAMRTLFDLARRKRGGHIAIVARSDLGSHPEFRRFAGATLDWLAKHPERRRFAFVTPSVLAPAPGPDAPPLLSGGAVSESPSF